LVAWCMEDGFATIEARFDSIFANFPNRPVAWLLRFLVLPLGLGRRGPSDRLTRACAEILLNPSATGERLTVGILRPRRRRPPAPARRARCSGETNPVQAPTSLSPPLPCGRVVMQMQTKTEMKMVKRRGR